VDWVEGGTAAVCGVLSWVNRYVGTLMVCVKYPAWSVVWVGCGVIFVWVPVWER
jgi:hypothetical protein